MFTPKSISPEKETLLLHVFADKSDPRIDFFSRKLTLNQLKQLVRLRNMVFENGEIEPFSINNYNLTLSEKYKKTSKKHLPKTDVDYFGAIFDLTINKKTSIDGREIWQRGSAQRPKVSRFEGAETAFYILTYTFSIYISLYRYAREFDRLNNIEVDSNKRDDLCQLKKSMCGSSDPYMMSDDTCYIRMSKNSDVSCHAGSYFALLNFAAIVMFGVTS